MRFVPMNCIRENMELGKTIYGERGQVLLKAGTILKNNYIQRMKNIGYNGIYIEDDLSKDIELQEIINEELRNETVQAVKKTFLDIKNHHSNMHMQEKKLRDLVDHIIGDALRNSNLMVNMIDLKVFDDYTFYHCTNVAVLSIVLGISLGLNKDALYKLGLGALLHDIGKIFIPKEILHKPGKLTSEEYEIMKTHSQKGYKYLKEKFDIPVTSYVSVLYHHERYDGGGYPEGKKGDEIIKLARIISIADTYDALIADRPYRKAYPPYEAMEYIMGNKGSMFDPQVTKACTRKIAPYPVGTIVQLSDSRIGVVAHNFEDCCMRPVVKIIKENDKILKETYFLNLKDDMSTINITIKEIIQL